MQVVSFAQFFSFQFILFHSQLVFICQSIIQIYFDPILCEWKLKVLLN